MPQKVLAMDSPRNISFLSVTLAILLTLFSRLWGNHAITNGLLIGAIVSITFFAVAWWTAHVMIKDQNRQRAHPVFAGFTLMLYILKIPLGGVALWYAIKHLSVNVFALAGGIALTQVAIFIGALSRIFNR